MKKTLWYNKAYFIACFVVIALSLYFCYTEITSYGFEGDAAINIVGGIIIAVIFLYFLIKMSPRLVLTDKGIYYKEFFKKSSFNDYSEYKFIKKAYYGYYDNPIYYIVLSKRQLSGDELCHINNVPMSETVIHMRYNEKNYNSFVKILPPKQAEMLKKEFKSMRAPKVNFIP